jgi:hypothetical protein
MAKATPIITALNGGEWSNFLDGRVDVEGYAASAYRCLNFIPTIEGPAVRRAGTRFVRQVKDVEDRTRLIPFVKARDDAVMIEFGDLYCRFYVNRAPVLSGSAVTITGATAADPVVITAASHGYSNGQDVFISGIVGMTELNGRWFKVANQTTNTFELQTIHGDDVDGSAYAAYTSGGTADIPYEIVSPYSAAALSMDDGTLGLDYAQIGDILYITDRSRTLAPRKLARSGATSWAFTELDPDDGPFEDVNGTDTTMYVSAATGTITITASTSVFTAADVGRLIRIDQQVITASGPWETGTAYTAGDFVRSEGKEYEAAGSATSGTTIPDHTSGTVSDGGVDWIYRSAGYGIARITAQSGTTATATVLTRFPQTLVGSGNASLLWRKGAWYADNYPSTVAFYRERLTFGGGLRLYMSAAGAYESFAVDDAGEILPESAITLELPGPANDIVAVQEGTALSVLTEGGEFSVGPQTQNEPVGPNNVQASGQTSYGAKAVLPVRVGPTVLFVQSSGRRVRAMQYSWETESFAATDMTLRARHVAQAGITRLQRQESPWGVVWATRVDGELVSFTFEPDQQARAWARHTIGAAVEDVAVIPSPCCGRDDVWVTVRRTVNGDTRRYVEYIRPEFEDGDDQKDAVYVDCSLTYDGAAASTFYGFDHLEGETLSLLVDGANGGTVTVTGGQFTLEDDASVVQAGLSYKSQYATNRINAGAGDGTAQTKTKRITDVAFRVFNTLGGKAGPDENNLDSIAALNYRLPVTPMGEAPPLFSGDALLSWPGGYETDGRIWFETEQPFPVFIAAIVPQVVTQEAR